LQLASKEHGVPEKEELNKKVKFENLDSGLIGRLQCSS